MFSADCKPLCLPDCEPTRLRIKPAISQEVNFKKSSTKQLYGISLIEVIYSDRANLAFESIYCTHILKKGEGFNVKDAFELAFPDYCVSRDISKFNSDLYGSYLVTLTDEVEAERIFGKICDFYAERSAEDPVLKNRTVFDGIRM